MILLNNVFFNNVEYDIIQKDDTYNIKLYDVSEKIWYGSNMKLNYDVKHNKNIFTIVHDFDINEKINIFDIVENDTKNIYILFHLNEIFLKKNIHIFKKNNIIVLISNENIDYIMNWLYDKNIYMPDVIYTAEHEYTYDFLHISKKIINFIKILYNLNFSKICIFNTNIYYQIDDLNQEVYDQNIIITNDIEDISIKNNNIFYIKIKNNNSMRNKNVLKELFNMNFYI
jgi:hypothetical protein